MIGPFTELGSTASISSSSSAQSTAGFVELGIAEAVGAGLLIVGMTSEKKLLIRNDKLTLNVAPMMGAGLTGLVAFGRF